MTEEEHIDRAYDALLSYLRAGAATPHDDLVAALEVTTGRSPNTTFLRLCKRIAVHGWRDGFTHISHSNSRMLRQLHLADLRLLYAAAHSAGEDTCAFITRTPMPYIVTTL